jgi:hypothetical protein
MNSTLAAQPGSRGVARQGSWRLGGRLRKTVLVLHIVAGGTWFGLDVAMAVLVVTAISTDSAVVRAHTAVPTARDGLADVQHGHAELPPIVSPTALTIAFLLAVFKPWGRIGRRSPGR